MKSKIPFSSDASLTDSGASKRRESAVPGTWSLADFERWLALQAALGYTVKNPEAVEKIRDAVKRGGTLTIPQVQP